jgi:uncharacterized protein
MPACYNRANYTHFIRIIVKPTRNPFLINIGFLINQSIGYSRAIPFESEEFDFGNGLVVKKLAGEIELIRNQDGFRSVAEFEGYVDNECGRCLESFQEHVHGTFEEFFTFPFVEPSDEEMQVPESGNVDFKPILHDYILIEIPISPVCKPDCKGLCDICGANRNTTNCGHKHIHDDEEPANTLDLEGWKKKLNK